MKALQNPVVTGVLVVVALGVVFYQLAPQWRGFKKAGPQVTSSIVPVSSPARQASATARPVTSVSSASAALGLDRAYIQAHLAEWVDSPKRDPFLLAAGRDSDSLLTANDSPSVVSQWKLKAIWRQTGSRLAAINQGIYREGDSIQDFKIERIEDDQVVVRGTNGIERLEFGRGVRPGLTNAPVSGTQPARAHVVQGP